MPRPTPGFGDRWLDACRLLNDRGVDYIVIGGVAVSQYIEGRGTNDIDILVPRDLKNTKKLLEALGDLPMGLARELNPEDIDRKPLTILGDDPRVDILKGAGGLSYKEALKSVEIRTVNGVRVPLASAEDLIKSKQTDRPQDQSDILKLSKFIEKRGKGGRADSAAGPTEEIVRQHGSWPKPGNSGGYT